jgi:hypothetical protein
MFRLFALKNTSKTSPASGTDPTTASPQRSPPSL